MKKTIASAMLSTVFGLSALTAPPSASAQNLWSGEQVHTAAGFPFITKFMGAQKSAPTVVFMPGRGSTARIGYGGHEGGQAQDFLAHWLNQQGYNFFGISYPVKTASGAFVDAHPDFTVRAWGRGAAELTQAAMKEHGLTGRVILATWSMAGKSVQPFSERAKALGMDIDFAVSLAATPPIPGILEPGDLNMDADGLVPMPPGARPGIAQLAYADKANDHTVIDPKILASEYLGATPVQLMARWQRYDEASRKFVEDPWADMQDTKFYDLESYPLMTMVVPSLPGDPRHALTDQAAWSLHIANKIFEDFAGGGKVVSKMPAERFNTLKKITRDAPARLATEVTGNHFFFVGEKGAKATAESIKELEGRVHALKADLTTALGTEVK